jgi:hypothetical protein
MSIDVPLRKLTVAAGRETIGFITEYSKRRFAAHLACGQQVGTFFRSSADAAQALSNAKGAQASTTEGGAK